MLAGSGVRRETAQDTPVVYQTQNQSGALGGTLAEDVPSPFPVGSHVTGGRDLRVCDHEGLAAVVWRAGVLLTSRAQAPCSWRPA